MKPLFGDIDRLKRAARDAVGTGFATIKRWWINKYQLPTTHALFGEQTLADLTQELYEDLYQERINLLAKLEEGTHGAKELEERLNEINKILGEDYYAGDALVDKWEKELEEGLTPNLEEGLDAN